MQRATKVYGAEPPNKLRHANGDVGESTRPLEGNHQRVDTWLSNHEVFETVVAPVVVRVERRATVRSKDHNLDTTVEEDIM